MSAPPCDQDVFDKGVSLLAIDGWAKDIEPWVESVAKHSGQRVDWHYSGGVAHVLVLGSYAKAMASANALESKLVAVGKADPDRPPRIMRRFANQETGLFRAGR